MRRRIILLGIALLLIVGGLFYFALRIGQDKTTGGNQGDGIANILALVEDPRIDGLVDAGFVKVLPNGSLRYFLDAHDATGSQTFWERTSAGEQKQLTNELIFGLRDVIWSPDGRMAILVIENTHDYVVLSPTYHTTDREDFSTAYYLIDFITKKVSRYAQQLVAPTWSPDGTKIAYAWDGTSLNIADPDGSNWHSLWSLPNDGNSAFQLGRSGFDKLAWPVSDTIYATTYQNSALGHDLHQINTASGINQLVVGGVKDFSAAPDGKQGIILRTKTISDEVSFWRTPDKGTPVATKSSLMVWSTDSRYLFIVEMTEDETIAPQILRLDPETGNYTDYIWPDEPFAAEQALLDETGKNLLIVGHEKIITVAL